MSSRLLYSFILFTALFVACESKDNESPYFEYTPQTADIPAEGGTFEISIDTNVDYYCETPDDWVKELASTSESIHRFKVMANTGEPRTSVVTLCANNACMVFRITQAGVETMPPGTDSGEDNDGDDDDDDDDQNGGDTDFENNQINWQDS